MAQNKRLTIVLSLLAAVSLFSFVTSHLHKNIPKTWDLEQVRSMHLPYVDTTVKVEYISEEVYNNLPVRTPYKSYPFYMPGFEPAGYYDSLARLDPGVSIREEDIKTEADWIKFGELIYEMPTNYITVDSAMQSWLPLLAEKWKAAGISGDKNGIIPFVTLTVRQKGKVEMGLASCGFCHTKQMPDGRFLKGGQGNFASDLFRNLIGVVNPVAQKRSPEEKLRVFYAFNKKLFYTPWVQNKYQEEYKKVKPEDIANSVFLGVLPAVQHRSGASFDHPISIPDLYFLKERKYLDKTGHNLNRGIGDIMRYAILNQNLSHSNSYNGFVPDSEPVPVDNNDYRRTGRFTDVQLYALAKFLYSLKPIPNPEKISPALLEKGKTIFIQQGCVTCHTPPLYTNNKLTPVDGFEPPAAHFKKYEIFNISVGTDPGLSLYTRRGSGYYKVPSLIGAWNRTAFLHDGHLKNLEDVFDSARLSPAYTPTYFKPIGVQQMAVPGHPFGMELPVEDKKALVAFIKSL
jgi:hypothetical protein